MKDSHVHGNYFQIDIFKECYFYGNFYLIILLMVRRILK